MPTWFITANDTGVGKTVLSVLLTRFLVDQGVPVRALKPFCSGGREDARALRRALRNLPTLDDINPWHYRAPLAPAVAAQLTGTAPEFGPVVEFLRTQDPMFRHVLIEGAGGLLTPLGPGFSARELIADLSAIPLVVCPNRLGVINQARLVWASLPRGTRRQARLVLMETREPDASARTNPDELARHLGAGRIHRLPWLPRGMWGPLDSRMQALLTRLLD